MEASDRAFLHIVCFGIDQTRMRASISSYQRRTSSLRHDAALLVEATSLESYIRSWLFSHLSSWAFILPSSVGKPFLTL